MRAKITEEIPDLALDLGTYERSNVTNVGAARKLFDKGLCLLLCYQHEEAAFAFLECVEVSRYCALAHALIALSHSPNYNFNGDDFHEASKEISDAERAENEKEDLAYEYPSARLATYHSQRAVNIVETLSSKGRRRKLRRRQSKNNDCFENIVRPISNVEEMIVRAVRTLICNRECTDNNIQANDRSFATEMRKVYQKYPNDPEVAYFYAESLMILNAWNLYDYPTHKPMSNDVPEVEYVLRAALDQHPEHVGLCHMYVHLCEMSPNPEKALGACDVLRTSFPDGGHLLHMPTHIDALVGDYEACVMGNEAAISADKKAMKISPSSTSISSFYFGYIAHNYHMLVYGAILGAMESKALQASNELNQYLNETTFLNNPHLSTYLESYATLDIHVLVRFGRWEKILKLDLPGNPELMIYRCASMRYARAISYANKGNIEAAKEEARLYEEIRANPLTKIRTLHNNTVPDLLDVDSFMIQGEIAYFEGMYEKAFDFLEQSIKLEDNLKYDEPWGKMQPVRHALGGLLLKRGFAKRAEAAFREDLKRHPDNPWALTGLRSSLRQKITDCDEKSEVNRKYCSCKDKVMVTLPESENDKILEEIKHLTSKIDEIQKRKWVDYDVTHSCACCLPKPDHHK